MFDPFGSGNSTPSGSYLSSSGQFCERDVEMRDVQMCRMNILYRGEWGTVEYFVGKVRSSQQAHPFGRVKVVRPDWLQGDLYLREMGTVDTMGIEFDKRVARGAFEIGQFMGENVLVLTD